MAGRLRFLVTYDIRNPSRLRKVHEVVSDFGEMLQYSVYVCDLTRQELVALRAKLRSTMNVSEDHVAIFDLGPPAGQVAKRVEHLGHAPDISDGGPAIW